jgi:antitoxin MazE
MKARIRKWGNSLALRIPRVVADELGLERDSLVDLTMMKKKLVVAPAPKEQPRLEELLDRVTSANAHPEADLGPPVGREAW